MLPISFLALIIVGLSSYWFYLADKLYNARIDQASPLAWLAFHSRLIHIRRKGDNADIISLLQRLNLTAAMTVLCMVLFGVALVIR